MLNGLGNLLGDMDGIKDALAKVIVDAENDYVRVTVNGLQKVLKVRLGPAEPTGTAQQEAALASCFEEAMSQARLRAKEELEHMMGLKMPDMP